jgi:hypothetical protein
MSLEHRASILGLALILAAVSPARLQGSEPQEASTRDEARHGLPPQAELARLAERLPADTVFFVQVDVPGLTASPLYQRYVPVLLAKAQVDEKIDLLGTDLRNLVGGWNPEFISGHGQGYFLSQVNFDTAELGARLRKSAGRVVLDRRDGIATYTVSGGSGTEPAFTSASPERRTVIGADPHSFSRLLAAYQGSSPTLESSPALGKLVSRPFRGHVRAVLATPPASKHPGSRQPFWAEEVRLHFGDQKSGRPQVDLSHVKAVDVVLQVTTEVRVEMDLIADASQNAKKIHELLASDLAAARLENAATPYGPNRLERVALELHGITCRVIFWFTAEDAEILLSTLNLAGPAPTSGSVDAETERKAIELYRLAYGRSEVDRDGALADLDEILSMLPPGHEYHRRAKALKLKIQTR